MTINHSNMLQYISGAKAVGITIITMESAHGGNGSTVSSGDSGSPVFMMLKTTPVIIFATTRSSGSVPLADANGYFISDPQVLAQMAAQNLTNGIKIVNLYGYRTY